MNGSRRARLPHNLNISVDGLHGEQLLMGLDDVAVSSGAACTSASREPSHVLRALGLGDTRARAAIRFGRGRIARSNRAPCNALKRDFRQTPSAICCFCD